MNRAIEVKTITEDRSTLQPWIVVGDPWQNRSTPKGLYLQTGNLDPISLEEMESVALLDRTDTKYMMTTVQLLSALTAIQRDYQILCIEGQRFHHYRTLYFDTHDFLLYKCHVNQQADRFKVRSREYADSNQIFLEVKHKTRKDRTIKDRIPICQPLVWMDVSTKIWLQDVYPYDSQDLEPKVWNNFTRITLVRKQCYERVTLDIDLLFSTGDKEVSLDGIVIAEVKTESPHQSSPFQIQMREQRIRPQGFSKYCMGVSMLYNGVKKNVMKPRLLWIERMMKGKFEYD